MPTKKCPGMDPAFFKFEDIKIHNCLECQRKLEFWKDDVSITCPDCGHKNFNPNLGNTCLSWCKEAAKCVGNEDINDWLARHSK